METKMRRPIVVWFALAYIAILLCINLLTMYRIVGVLPSLGTEDALFLLLNLGFCCLIVFTFLSIRGRAAWGRRLAILSFVLLGVFGIFNGVTVLQMALTTQDNLLFAKIVVIVRIVASFLLAFAFGVSKSVDRYFAENPSDPFAADPPPPPSFD